MTISSGQQGPLYLGIDGGGSKCRVVIVNADNQLLGEGLGGPANPLRGMKIATDSILTATQQALTAAGMTFNDMSRLIAGAGLAGVNMPQYFRLFSEWKHPFAAFYLTTDLHIACIGAHNGGDGAVIIAGTGSCGLADVKGRLLDIGGHGFPYGDNGSGAWFGMQLVHHALLQQDGLEPSTLLSSLLCQELCVSNSLDIVSHFMHATPTVYARYAPLVFSAAEQGDATALAIVAQGAAFINEIALKLFELSPPRFSMIGGLAYKLVPYLDSKVQQALTPALAAPEYGAVWFARQQQALLTAAVAAQS
ncbi:N-acetylglucosamine kinase [Rheinheimera sp. 4Y26]|uniref:N-acetylglucosamine kinase n=1 Tax=Rheinheimera sp. 4Y26 TaxID=2977811 RepID=UPI0021B1277F|nr:BadF/BadG/BcrA/BcrD ATPase family protein [Rheinheimera sp. 4Y26]MCT6698738.1 ATPase [Rheinheimera sp. 4Y26]